MFQSLHLLHALFLILLAALVARMARAGEARRRDTWPAALVFLGAGTRLVFLFEMSRWPLLAHPQVDAEFYFEWASRLARGIPDMAEYWVDPLYAYLMGAIFRWTGPTLVVPTVLGLVCGLGSLGLIQHIVSVAMGRRWGRLAGLAFALYPVAWLFDIVPLKSTPATFGVLVFIACLMIDGRRMRPAVYCLAGVGLGFAVGLGAQLGLLVVPGSLQVWYRNRREGRAHRFRCASMFLACFLLPLSPFLIHHAWITGSLAPTQVNAGMTLYVSNNPESNGRLTHLPFLREHPRFEVPDWVREASRRTGRNVTPFQASRYWAGEARRHAMANPGHIVSLVAARFGFTFHAYEWPDNYDDNLVPLVTAIGTFPLATTGVIAPLGLVAILILLGAGVRPLPPGPRFRHRGFILGCLAALACPLLLFYVSTRMRFVFVTGLFLVFPHALARLAWAWRRGRRGYAAALTAGILVTTLWCHRPIEQKSLGTALTNLAAGFLFDSRHDEALALYELTLRLEPDNTDALMNGAYILRKQGQHARALAHYEELLRIEPRLVKVHHEAGDAARLAGDAAAAVRHYGALHIAEPADVAVAIKLGLALIRSGDADTGRGLLVRARNLSRQGGKAGYHVSPEMLQEAEEELRRAMSSVPAPH